MVPTKLAPHEHEDAVMSGNSSECLLSLSELSPEEVVRARHVGVTKAQVVRLWAIVREQAPCLLHHQLAQLVLALLRPTQWGNCSKSIKIYN